MTIRRQEKIASLLGDLISEFLIKLNLEKKLISIVRLDLSENLKTARISVTIYPVRNKSSSDDCCVSNGVYPEKKFEEEGLKMLKLKIPKIRKYIGSKVRWRFLPELIFEIDRGERNRQRIEEILNKAR